MSTQAQHLPIWVPILAALLTPTIAIAGVYIAAQQWRTNRNKLKLELFDRRYAFYEAATELIGRVITTGKASSSTTLQFLMKTKGAKFIVGAALAEYLDKLYREASLLHSLDSELEGVPAGPERSQNVRRQREIKEWISSQYDVLDIKFAPLLRLKH
ncbi:MAG: hypothetical protein ACT4O5_02060 [Gammaproteobacteria bacterium]